MAERTEMDFPFGISAGSLARWTAFQRISATGQGEHDESLRYIIDLELEAIERATAERQRREARQLRQAERLRPQRSPAPRGTVGRP